jgi:hypothetical protein
MQQQASSVMVQAVNEVKASAAVQQKNVGFSWRRKAVPPPPNMLRRIRRKIGGAIAYGVTFYRTAAK